MMRKIAPLALAVLALLPVAPVFAKGSKGSAPPPAPHKPTHDEEAADFIQTVEGTRHNQNDGDAVTSVKKLVGYWNDATVAPQTKQPIPNLVTWYAKHKSGTVALAGINGLATIGKGPGSQNLVHVLEGLLAQKDAPQDQITAAFAGLKSAVDPDPVVTGPLAGLAADKDAKLVASAIDVFSAYGTAPIAARKRLFEQLLGTFETMAAAAAKATDKDAVDKWTAIAPSAVSVVGALSHQQFADLPAARKWFAEQSAKPDAWK